MGDCSHADKLDWVLMLFGTLGAAVNGKSQLYTCQKVHIVHVKGSVLCTGYAFQKPMA